MTKTTIRDLFAAGALLLVGLAMVAAWGCQHATEGAADPSVRQLPGGSRGLYDHRDPASHPLAGAFFNDGEDGDIRARTERYLAEDLGDVLQGVDFGKAGGVSPGGAIDELVVVERADGHKQLYGPDRIAALRAKVDGKAFGQPLPLQHTDVAAKVALNISSVTVTQTFHNPFASKIEAVYVFPLPQDAAVSDFVMKLGDRRIRGIVRERDEARRIYEQARAQGYNASLLQQERPNIFTQSVANIEPDQTIDVATTYFQTLPWRDGAFEMVVPTVVGPRFQPAGRDDGVGAIAADAPGTSGQPVEVPYRVDAAGDGPGIAIEVALDAGIELGEIACKSHQVAIARDGEQRATVALRDGEAVPNRDFVLRYAPKQQQLGGAVSMQLGGDSGDGWFTVLLQPPAGAVDGEAMPREMVFVVDCSGSMSGEPIAVCKRAIRSCLERLRPEDTFTVIRFSDAASSLGEAPLHATPQNVRRAMAYVESLGGGGGTMMSRGVRAALQPRVAEGRRRIVTFMTDGFIGNEREILGIVRRHVGGSRIFSFGVGTSVNRYLLERMADVGRGVAAYIDVSESGQRQVDELFRRIERPALADLSIDWGGAEVCDVEPQRLPDLFCGRPILVHGRVKNALPKTVTLRGKAGRDDVSVALPVQATREHPAIAKLWARARIRTLADAVAWVATPDKLRQEILQLALAHGLASEVTSFVAVDASRTTDGEFGTTVPVAVPVPRGTKYETTVPGGGR
ncbi:MAG: VIT domain-containing protein [Planctomycetota bacterium]